MKEEERSKEGVEEGGLSFGEKQCRVVTAREE
jgi:hypothetical protein